MNHPKSAVLSPFQIFVIALWRKEAARILVVFSVLLLLGGHKLESATTFTWTGTSNNNWNNAANWSPSGTPAPVADDVIDVSTLDLVANKTFNLNNGTTTADRTAGTWIFGDTNAVDATTYNWTVGANGGAGSTPKLILAVTSGTGVIQVNNGTTTINPIVAGTSGLAKTGSGTLVLANAGNTLTGGIFLNAGTLSFATGALNNNTITVGGTSGLTWNTAGDVTDLSSRIILGNGFTLTLNLSGGATDNTIFASTIATSGGTAGALTKANGGILTITAAQNYTGATKINNGRVILTGGDDRLVGTTALTFGNSTNSGVLQLGDVNGASNQTVASLAISGTGAASAIVGGNASNSTFTINNTANITGTNAPIFGGAGTNENHLNLIKSGAGSLTLAKSSTFTGDVNITGGAVILTGNNTLGAGSKTVTISGTMNAPSLQLNNAGGIALASSIGFITSNDSATGALVNTAGANVIGGNIALAEGGFGGAQTRIKVNGGSLTLNGSITAHAGAVSARALILDGAANGTVNGVISDYGTVKVAVNKEGAGIWTLNAANSYSGATTVSAGQLNITTAQTGGGAITLSDGATLGITLAGVGQTLNTSAFTLGVSTGATLSLNLGSSSNPSAALINAAAFTANGNNTINVAGTGLSVGTFDLVSYTGVIGGSGFAGLTLGSLPSRVSANLIDNVAASKVQLHITAFDVPKWTGATDNVWDINDGADPTTGTGTVNWKEANSGNATRYLQVGNAVDSVLFDDSATGSKDVNLSATLTPTTVTVNNSTTGGDYIFSGTGKLSGSTALTKQGNGKLIFANTGGNDNSGTTTIISGLVQAGDGVVTGAGQLGSGSIAIGISGTLALNRPSGDDITFSNTLTGSGALIQQGGNTVTLSGNNATYDGAITVTTGALRVGSTNALGTAVGGVAVLSAGALEFTGQTVTDAIQLQGGTLRAFSLTTTNITQGITLNGGGTLDGLNATILTVSSAITGTGGLNKTGNGTAVLTSNANSYTGTTTITQGVLQLGAAGGSTTGLFGSGDIDFTPTAGNTATLTILRGDSALNISNTITSTGTGTGLLSIGVTGAGSLSGTVTLSGANTFTGNVTINGGALKITNSSALGTGTKVVSIGSNAGPSLQLDGTVGNLTLASGIDFKISSDGTVVNAASNTGAIVNLAGDNIINGKISVINGGGGNGRIQAQGGSLTLNGNIDSAGATGARTLQIGGSGTGTINGVIADDSFVLNVTKDGSGTWTLAGENTFTGTVTVNAGTLRIGEIAANGTAQSLGAAVSAITLGTATTSGTLEYTGSTDVTLERAITVGGVGGGIVKNSGGAVLTLSNTLTKNGRPLTLTGGEFVVSGQIVGASANSDLIVDNALVTLTHANNTYNGPTFVTGGGILKNGVTNALPAGTLLTLGEAISNTGGTYDLNGFDSSVTGLAGAGTGAKVVTNSGISGANALTVSGASSFGGSIKDGANAQTALIKSGTGALTLTGSNSYTGATTVSGGALIISSSGLISSNVTVNTAGELSVSGIINGNVSLDAGSSFQTSGASNTGLATINGGLTLNSGSDLFFDIGGTTRGSVIGGYDAIDGLSSLTLAGTVHIGFSSGFVPVGDEVFNLFDWTNLTPSQVIDNGVTFDFSLADPGEGRSWSTADFLSSGSISFTTAAAVPEPGRAMLLGVGLATLFLRRRRPESSMRLS